MAEKTYLEDCPFRDAKWTDLVNKFGCVKDLEFAKYLIKLMWGDNTQHRWDPGHSEFMRRVENELFQYNEDEFTFYDKERDRVDFTGSPGGYSGIIFREFSTVASDLADGYGFEDIMNTADKVICVVEDKPRIFVVHEMD